MPTHSATDFRLCDGMRRLTATLVSRPLTGRTMRILMIGAGGVGSSAALIGARRDFFDHWVVADYDGARAQALVDRIGDDRFSAMALDAMAVLSSTESPMDRMAVSSA